ncbi:lysophospholipid acyltransferase family protein [Oleidesulfovibrio alaskensis]|uniref:lysophospholipid acyltransferase family protein n=1 Tax=Oleidesulfovibrio alaskensis TaxID=58180 RepID=UPI00041D6727|nr:lysophospholipid acyltransferase family protein [Oleidesulfovibrio alaskensis]
MFDFASESALFIGSRIGFSTVRRCGRGLGTLLWHILPDRRKLAVESIQKRLGAGRRQAEAIARESFKSNCQSFAEILLNPRLKDSLPPLTDIDDAEQLARVLALPRPIVGITAHLGAWEMLTGCLSQHAHCGKEQLVVTRRQKNMFFQKAIVALRSANNLRIVDHRNAARPVLKALKNNAIACFLADHNCSEAEALFLPFLGKTAAVNRGPAILAVRAKALVLPAFMIRAPNGRFRFHHLPPLDTTELEGTADERVEAVTRYYNSAIESMVKKYPEQWFWMHKRWKTQPSGSRRVQTEKNQGTE